MLEQRSNLTACGLSVAELEERFQYWCSILRLDHWQFELRYDEEPEAVNREAEIVIACDYDCATIRLSQSWPEWPLIVLDEALIHELVHAQLHNLHAAALEGVHGFSSEAAELYTRRVVHELERAVDAFTVTLLKQCGMIELS